MLPALAMNPTMTSNATLAAAVEVVRRRSELRPAAALILGSGLGGLADEVEKTKNQSKEKLRR